MSQSIEIPATANPSPSPSAKGMTGLDAVTVAVGVFILILNFALAFSILSGKAMFAELEKLHTTLGEQLQLKVDDPREQQINSLAGKYAEALADLQNTAKIGGDTKLVAEIAAELLRHSEEGTVPETLSSNGGLAQHQRTLKTETDKIEAKAKQNRADLLGKYDDALVRLIATLKEEGRTEDIERVEQERERIAAEG